MKIEVRQETETDFAAVFELNNTSFEQDVEARLVDLLRNSSAFIPELSLVATIGNAIVGHILFTKISRIRNDEKEFDSLALAPMAVRPDLQRQGIGGQLIRYGLDKARELGYTSVIVLGHEHYYPKFGFEPAEKSNIKSPYDVPSNVFMGIELVSEGLKNVSGMVQYSKEFEMV
jgi:putative acetyltransferase